jgi:hypothetical protein
MFAVSRALLKHAFIGCIVNTNNVPLPSLTKLNPWNIFLYEPRQRATPALSQTDEVYQASTTKHITAMQNTNSALPQASEIEIEIRVAALSSLPLPTEIMLQILGDVLELPNGVHSDR